MNVSQDLQKFWFKSKKSKECKADWVPDDLSLPPLHAVIASKLGTYRPAQGYIFRPTLLPGAAQGKQKGRVPILELGTPLLCPAGGREWPLETQRRTPHVEDGGAVVYAGTVNTSLVQAVTSTGASDPGARTLR